MDIMVTSLVMCRGIQTHNEDICYDSSLTFLCTIFILAFTSSSKLLILVNTFGNKYVACLLSGNLGDYQSHCQEHCSSIWQQFKIGQTTFRSTSHLHITNILKLISDLDGIRVHIPI